MYLTQHQYVNKYPIKPTDKYLILGTIHPHSHESFEVDFFYGNKNSLWDIVSEACSISLDTLEEILSFLTKHQIAVSDIILECERCDPKITQDSGIKPTKFNIELKEQILNSDIRTIFFTSAFGVNNVAQLFFREFCLKKPKDWNKEREFPISFFGKKIHCVLLYSPSGQANRGIAGSNLYKKAKEENSSLTITEYRNDCYRTQFCKIISSP